MLIIPPTGYILTSAGEFIPGGPSLVGFQMDSVGRIYDIYPKFNKYPASQETLNLAKKQLNPRSYIKTMIFMYGLKN